MSYEKVLSQRTCYEGLFNTHFSMVNLDLSVPVQMLKNGTAPFKKLTRCNMGNPCGVGQKEITVVRQLIAACLSPEIRQSDLIPEDVKARANVILSGCPGGNSGSYCATEGIEPIRVGVAEYITKRDGYKCDHNSVVLTNGATEAILSILRPIIRSKFDAILIPRPGFPMYNAAISYYGGAEVSYDLDEDNNWSFSLAALESALDECKVRGLVPRCIVLTNPSNPTGTVQTYQDIQNIIEFAYKNSMMIIADQVYQHNIYEVESYPFISCRKVMLDLNKQGKCQGLELVSINSVSKSCYGECGRRGGYWQYENLDQKVVSQLLDIVSLGATNTDGMIAMDVYCNPPKPGSVSYPLWKKEYDEIFNALQSKARMVAQEMNGWEGLSCCVPTGAMYVYPRIHASQKAVEAAKKLGKEADELYCKDLVEETGIVVLPGSMFGQKAGTYHFRMTILLNQEDMEEAIGKWKTFHHAWMTKYQ
ncbi:Alanine_aminotransferase [Hexamita inflata]|uniref:Alanine aminotransferase n=2 Tax=Hexamita inflata TaxID=28002 RepID=A0AA86UNW0_9EUKA|nr:Alanine aminotransferase [Hexamita inflata]